MATVNNPIVETLPFFGTLGSVCSLAYTTPSAAIWIGCIETRVLQHAPHTVIHNPWQLV